MLPAPFGNASAATNVLNGWTAAPEKNEATLTNLLNLYCTAVGNQTKAQVITAVQNAITAYVNEVTSSRDWIAAHEDDIENAAKKGVTDYQTADAAKGDKGYSASNGLVQSAVTGVQNAYDNSDPKKVDLVSAVADFAESAKGFAQTTTAALNAATMVQATGASSVDTRWIAQDKNFEETGVYTYKVLNSNIEDKEVSDATAVKFNPNWENVAVNNDMVVVTVKDKSGNTVDNYRGNDLNALEYRSWLAFGLVDRYVAPEDYEVLAIQSNTSNGNVVESKAEIYWDDVADVEKQQAIIDAQDDLKELQAALTDGKKAFLDQIAKDYTDNFGELQADYTEALAAHEKAVANLSDVREKLFGELDAEIDRLTAEIKANRDVYQKLKQLAWKYLNITWPEDSTNPDAPYTKPNDEYDPETFATELQEAIAYQQVLVAEAQQAVQEAQVNLDQATSGEYDGVHYFQFKLDQIQREWDRAYAEYEKAMANLEKGMAVIAEQAGSEQPAE